jgi:hypothetical protein
LFSAEISFDLIPIKEKYFENTKEIKHTYLLVATRDLILVKNFVDIEKALSVFTVQRAKFFQELTGF